MNRTVDYRIFFTLREQYRDFPKRRSLLADLMRFSFEHYDVFPDDDYLYLKDNYSEEDIKLIFEDLHLPYFKVLSSSSSSKPISIVQLKDTSIKGKGKP